jgi:hypothetical protein
MAGQYTEFLAYLNRLGVAKTSHFRLSIPVGITGTRWSNITDNDKILGLRCEATELPGRQLVSNDSRTYGPTYKTPYQSLYQEITVNFLETSDFFVRGLFEGWMNRIFDSNTNLLGYPADTRLDTTLTQYDVMLKDEKDPASSLRQVAVWQLYNTWPTAINQMPVSWTEDGLHRTTVTLAFEWYSLSTAVEPIPQGASTNKSTKVPPKGSSGGFFSSLNPF